ncbi:MAG TPA: hypothetical protein VGO00_00010 [Kofleriaceae bacterium]|nr:hypothetical protein [Kofleriaceae bacterium]
MLVLAVLAAGCEGEQRDASPTALRIALVAERREGTPCLAFAAGTRVTVGEVAYQFDRPRIVGAEVVVPCALGNLATGLRSPPDGVTLVTRDGASYPGHLPGAPDQLAPGQRTVVGYRFDVEASQLDGAVLYVHQVAYERGRYGTAHPIVRAHVVVDLNQFR